MGWDGFHPWTLNRGGAWLPHLWKNTCMQARRWVRRVRAGCLHKPLLLEEISVMCKVRVAGITRQGSAGRLLSCMSSYQRQAGQEHHTCRRCPRLPGTTPPRTAAPMSRTRKASSPGTAVFLIHGVRE